MEIIKTNNAPEALWPYSQAIRAWNFLYCSGQIWLDPVTMELASWIENQTTQVINNIWAVLREAWSDFSQVIKTTMFLKNIWDFATVNEIYSKYFSHKPARSTVEVSNLPKWALIEIEVIVYN